MSQDLLYYLVGAANQQRATWTSLSVETSTSCGRPSSLLPDVGERTSVARKEIIGRLLRCLCDIAERVHADLESIGRVTRTLASLPVEVDERTEAVRLPAYDCDHQGKSERAGTNE